MIGPFDSGALCRVRVGVPQQRQDQPLRSRLSHLVLLTLPRTEQLRQVSGQSTPEDTGRGPDSNQTAPGSGQPNRSRISRNAV